MQYLKCIEKFVSGKIVFCGINVHKHHWDVCYFSDGMIVEKIKMISDFKKLAARTKRYYESASGI